MTNSPIESYNNTIKESFTKRIKYHMKSAALAELIVVIDWESAGINNIIQGLQTKENFVQQAGQLAHLAICLCQRQCFAGARYISNVLTTKFLVNVDYFIGVTEPRLSTLKETVVSFIDMLVLIDGPPFFF